MKQARGSEGVAAKRGSCYITKHPLPLCQSSGILEETGNCFRARRPPHIPVVNRQKGEPNSKKVEGEQVKTILKVKICELKCSMHVLTYKILSNIVIVQCIKNFLKQSEWIEFLLSLCNSSTGNQDSCDILGLSQYLLHLSTPLCHDWDWDEKARVLTI